MVRALRQHGAVTFVTALISNPDNLLFDVNRPFANTPKIDGPACPLLIELVGEDMERRDYRVRG
jgi:hypothetical protein